MCVDACAAWRTSVFRTVALEAFKVTANVAAGAQTILESVDSALGANGRKPSVGGAEVSVPATSHLAHPPADVHEGMRQVRGSSRLTCFLQLASLLSQFSPALALRRTKH